MVGVGFIYCDRKNAVTEFAGGILNRPLVKLALKVSETAPVESVEDLDLPQRFGAKGAEREHIEITCGCQHRRIVGDALFEDFLALTQVDGVDAGDRVATPNTWVDGRRNREVAKYYI